MGESWTGQRQPDEPTGETDNIVEGSKQMIDILDAKGIRNRGDIWAAPYGHDWPWWKVQIRSYVP